MHPSGFGLGKGTDKLGSGNEEGTEQEKGVYSPNNQMEQTIMSLMCVRVSGGVCGQNLLL